MQAPWVFFTPSPTAAAVAAAAAGVGNGLTGTNNKPAVGNSNGLYCPSGPVTLSPAHTSLLSASHFAPLTTGPHHHHPYGSTPHHSMLLAAAAYGQQCMAAANLLTQQHNHHYSPAQTPQPIHLHHAIPTSALRVKVCFPVFSFCVTSWLQGL